MIAAAKDAYSKKDRSSETAAWRALLAINPEAKEAVQYFTDLGTLQIELDKINEIDASRDKIRALIGTHWNCRWNTGVTQKVRFASNTLVTKRTIMVGAIIENGKVIEVGPDFLLVEFESSIEKFVVAGNRILCEQWCPKKNFPRSQCDAFAIGIHSNPD